MDKTLSSWIRRWGPTLAVWLAMAAGAWPAVFGQGEPEKEKDKEEKAEDVLLPARQNELLRQYFQMSTDLTLFNTLETETTLDTRKGRRRPQLSDLEEKLIDQRIDRFLREIQEKMDSAQTAIKILVEAAEAQSNPVLDRPMAEALGSLTHQVGSLHGSLSRVFNQLPSKGDCRLEPSSDWNSDLLQLRDAYESAIEGVRQYLLQPNHTVQLQDLKDNMLIRLQCAEKFGKALQKTL